MPRIHWELSQLSHRVNTRFLAFSGTMNEMILYLIFHM